MRKHAESERRRRLEAGVVDSTTLAGRISLYGEIANRLEEEAVSLDGAVTKRLRDLLAEPKPLVDYGPYARARDAEVAAIRDELRRSEQP